MSNQSQPHSGLTVVKDYNTFVNVNGRLVREFDLKCVGCGTVWTRVAPMVNRPTMFCDECAALLTACDLKAQELWSAALTERKSWKDRLPHFDARNGNTGVYGLRDLLFAHVRGAAELSRWDKRQLADRFHYQVPAFGSKTV